MSVSFQFTNHDKERIPLAAIDAELCALTDQPCDDKYFSVRYENAHMVGAQSTPEIRWVSGN